ncbi:hypothetical protein N8651_03755 [Akkermansiaceae bacterium]|nr:hypothetical protein [Akkermansiaceae bacterium]
MNKKIAYLNHIEDNTVYPAYRKAVKFLNYIWAILIMVTAGGAVFFRVAQIWFPKSLFIN